jgi:hypothetical protein
VGEELRGCRNWVIWNWEFGLTEVVQCLHHHHKKTTRPIGRVAVKKYLFRLKCQVAVIG